MGCSADDSECHTDEQPTRKVTFSNGFWLSNSEVSVAAWKAAGATLPPPVSWGGYNYDIPRFDDTFPLVGATWEEARAYCTSVDGRLPTEAEWGSAARAGTAGARHGRLSRIAWLADTSSQTPLDSARLADDALQAALVANRNQMQRVDALTSNAWGLGDMLGNAAEWVEDDYAENTYSWGQARRRTHRRT